MVKNRASFSPSLIHFLVASLTGAAMSVALVLTVLFLASYQEEHVSHAVEVSTPNGIIIGSDRRISRDGRRIFSFTGIPYAEPPVGKLRFKESQPVRPWETPLDATKPCPACAQTSFTGEFRMTGQEDCLCLNVYSPSLNVESKLPVLLFIHGGAYYAGGTHSEPDFLLGDLVLVEITYRLGVLGFATTGDGNIPGNLGMKDMVLALKWVQKNIRHFGGDPNLVTVIGNSAGATSTHLLLLSPLTKGLVHRGISMGGAAQCPWATSPEQVVIDRTKALAVLCGCPIEPSGKLFECLQNIPVRDLLEMQRKFTDGMTLPLAPFSPVIEAATTNNSFLTTNPSKIETEIPWMIGINSFEGLFYPPNFMKVVEQYGLNLEEYFYSKLSKLLLLDVQFAGEEIPSAASKIKEFYFGNGPITIENISNMDDMVSDGYFLRGVIEAVSKYKGNTYLYFYEYRASQNVSYSTRIGSGLKNRECTVHGDDLLSLFPLTSIFPHRPPMSSTDLEVSKKMVNLWTTFAKYGTLETNSVTTWDPVDKKTSHTNFMHITRTAEFQQKEDFLKERADFWRSLVKF